MAQYSFGTGAAFGVSDAEGATPIQFAGLQDISVDFTFTEKELYSSYQFPIAVARGSAKIAGKATFAQFNARVLNDLFFAESSDAASGQNLVTIAENNVIPTTPFEVTVTNAATFTTDLGVNYTVTGLPLNKVDAAPATGQYMVDEDGVYTFAAADVGKAVKISYVYTAVSGKTINISNQLLGASPFFTLILTNEFRGKRITLTLNRCMPSKFSLPFKMEDFTLANFEFSAFADDANNVGTLTLAE